MNENEKDNLNQSVSHLSRDEFKEYLKYKSVDFMVYDLMPKKIENNKLVMGGLRMAVVCPIKKLATGYYEVFYCQPRNASEKDKRLCERSYTTGKTEHEACINMLLRLYDNGYLPQYRPSK